MIMFDDPPSAARAEQDLEPSEVTRDEWENEPDSSARPADTGRKINDDERDALHDYLKDAEYLARLIRVASGGYLSLAVVHNNATTLQDRQGIGWGIAHHLADQLAEQTKPGATPPRQVTQAMIDQAMAVYGTTPGERPGMFAVLTALNLYTPENLETALNAYIRNYRGVHDSMRDALAAVLQGGKQ